MLAPAAATRAGLLRRPSVGVALGLAAAGGVALHVWVYRSALGIPDSDEAVVGLMARHILHGQFTTFFWGQAYGGSQEALLTAPVFAVFGSSWVSLRVVPVALAAVASLVLWRVGRLTTGEPAAAAAAALLWIWPPFQVYELTHQLGFYGAGTLYCALLLLLALRVAAEPTALRCAVFGLVIGLALWQDTQLVPVIVPIVAWTIWKQPRSLRQLWVAVPFFVLGALPWLVWNAHHGFQSFSSPLANTTTYQHRLRIFVSPLLPMLLGLRSPYTQQPLLATAFADLVYAALVAAAVYGAWRSRKHDASLLYAVVVAFPLIYAISPQTLLEQVPRYLLVLSPVLALLVAQLATTRTRVFAVLAAAAVVSVVTLHRMDTWASTVPPDPPIAPRNLQPLIRTLDRLGVDHVYATYWLAYRLDFDSRERIVTAENRLIAVSFAGNRGVPATDPHIRYPAYARKVAADPRHGFVFFDREPGAERRIERARVQAALAAHGYVPHRVSIFTVYAPRQ